MLVPGHLLPTKQYTDPNLWNETSSGIQPVRELNEPLARNATIDRAARGEGTDWMSMQEFLGMQGILIEVGLVNKPSTYDPAKV